MMADSQAKWDARTLAEAKVITSDSARLARAQDAAKRLAEEQQAQAKAMSSVAKSPNVRVPSSTVSASQVKLNGSYT